MNRACGLEHRHGPQDTVHAAHAGQFGVAHGHNGVGVRHAGVHNPDRCDRHIGDHTGQPADHVDHDARLLIDQQHGKGHAQHQPKILGRITKQHFQGDTIHANDSAWVHAGLE